MIMISIVMLMMKDIIKLLYDDNDINNDVNDE